MDTELAIVAPEDLKIEMLYASEVVSFHPGEGAGFGQENFPEVVLGAPEGGGAESGGLDVLSLGGGGSIVLKLPPGGAVDGPGPDLLIFENAFWPSGDSVQVFAELAEVSVSEDGVDWVTFPCETEAVSPGQWPGCAGWNPTLSYASQELIPLNLFSSGGDPFDLSEVHLSHVNFIRIRDLGKHTTPPTAGFDLDAVGIIHPGYP